MNKDEYYRYYAKRIYQVALEDADVDESDPAEMSEYTKKWADKLCLPQEPLVNRMSEVMVATGFTKASDLYSPATYTQI